MEGVLPMNRRNRNKKETDLFDGFQERVTQLEWRHVKTFWVSLPKLHRHALMVLIPVVLILLVWPAPATKQDASNQDASRQVATNVKPVRTEVSVNTRSLSDEGTTTKLSVTSTDAWQEYTVKSGDTLSKVFRANHLSMSDLNSLVAIEGLDKPLSKIKAGQLVRFKLATEGHLDILQLEKSGSSVMFFRLSDGGYGRSR